MATVKTAVTRCKASSIQVYLPDVVLLATAYKDWTNYGATAGNFLSFGEFPDPALVQNELVGWRHGLSRRPMFCRRVSSGPDDRQVVPFDQANVTENVAHAWYTGSASVCTPRKARRY